jgi:hypothetical protein
MVRVDARDAGAPVASIPAPMLPEYAAPGTRSPVENLSSLAVRIVGREVDAVGRDAMSIGPRSTRLTGSSGRV